MSLSKRIETMQQQQKHNKTHFQLRADNNTIDTIGNVICLNRADRQRMSIALRDKIDNSINTAKSMESNLNDLVEREGTSSVSDAMRQQIDYTRDTMVPEYEGTMKRLNETLVCKT